MAYQYPATEGLQHISHDHESSGLYYDERPPQLRDAAQSYDKQSPDYYSELPKEYFNHHQQYLDQTSASKKPKRVCGLSRTVLILLIIIAVLVIAGAVGGGVGGSLANKNRNASTTPAEQVSSSPNPSSAFSSSASSSSTSSPTSSSSTTSQGLAATATSSTTSTSTTSTIATSSTIPTPTTTAAALAILGCPSANGTTYTPSSNNEGKTSFLKYCYRDLQSPTFSNVDIQSRVQNDFNSCIDSCVAYTAAWTAGGKAGVGPCIGVAYNALIPDFPYNNLRCFLKASAGDGLVFTSQVLENVMASALVVT